MKRLLSTWPTLIAAGVLSLASTATLAQTELSLWYHGAGNEVEKNVLVQIIEDFNGSQADWKVSLAEFPQASYNESIVAAALANRLPDIIDVDGPIMPNWAWSKYMAPLDLTDADLAGHLPGTIGRYNDKIYSVGLWDAAVALMARRSVLESFEIRIPTLDEPWTKEEFDAALAKIKESDQFDYPFDPGLAWTGEWYSYAFGPMLQSFGGDLMDASVPTAEGVLNGEAGQAFGHWWQGLFQRGLVPGTSQDPASRETGFLDGKYAIQLNGNWAALAAVEKFGEDLLFLPAVDFGNGPKIGAASWQFGISANSSYPEGGNAFIKFALQDKYMTQFSDAIGLIPPTKTAAAASKHYGEGGAMVDFFDLSDKQAQLRALSPGYGVASLEFEKALSDIANGGDVTDVLDTAADAINADLKRNNNYQ